MLMGASGTANSDKGMTFGLGESFSAIEQWAEQHDFRSELILTYHLLGLDRHTVAVANLTSLLVEPESQAILADWSDSKLAQRLLSFALAFEASGLQKSHSALVISGTNAQVRAEIRDTTTSRFLLYLFLTSSPNLSYSKQPDKCVYNHRKLILWLVLQAAKRLIGENKAPDSLVSDAARFLANEHDDANWHSVCAFLDYVQRLTRGGSVSYEQFSDAVAIAAAKESRPKGISRSSSRFLNDLMRLAAGEVHAIQVSKGHDSPQLDDLDGLTESPSSNSEAPRGIENSLGQVFYPVEEIDQDAGELSSSTSTEVVLSVDPTDTAAEHAISAKSFHLLTLEEVNYLPWSLSGVLPPEQSVLQEWIAVGLSSSDRVASLGAAIVDLAQICSRSLYYTLAFKISDVAGHEWSLSSDLADLVRLAPRRANSWEPAAEQVKLIAPFERVLRIKIPPATASALNQALRSSDIEAKTLHELWAHYSSEKLEAWFNREKDALLSRVLTTMPGRLAAQRTFNFSGDPNFTRLFSAEPNSGLPGACAYGYSSAGDLRKTLNPIAADIDPATPDDVNVMGSRLVMTRAYLEEWVANIKKGMKAASTDGFIAYHNRITVFCVTALYAATGCRHCNDPFESLAHFDLTRKLVYINDKSDTGLHDGRLVPLPDKVCAIIDQYVQYLKVLASHIAGAQPELSRQLALLATKKSAELPLFFLLDEKWHWRSVSILASNLPGLPLATWALRANQLRHRYSQELPRRGVDHEVVDAWMGHAEAGASTYSDASPRCWITDAEHFRHIAEALYNELGLPEALPDPPLSALAGSTPKAPISIRTSTFGISRRQEERRNKRRQAIRDAHRDINLFLRNRKIADLDKREVEKLSKRMLHGDRSTRIAFASTRLDVLNRRIRKEGDPSKRVISRIVVSMHPEQSHLKQSALGALEAYPILQHWASRLLSNTSQTRLSRANAAIIGALLLCILKRISYERLLTDVASGENYRILKHGERYFIEYSEKLDLTDFTTAVQRHEINFKLASLLQRGSQHSKKGNALEIEVHPLLSPLTSEPLTIGVSEDITVARLIGEFADVVGQNNLITLPGIAAGALSERCPPSSAPIQDLLRITEGLCLSLLTQDRSEKEVVNDEIDDLRIKPHNVEKSELQENAKTYAKAIYSALKEYQPTLQSARQTAATVLTITERHADKVSPSILLLGHWIGSRVLKGKGTGKKFKALASDTIRNYFSTLRNPFCENLYETSLIELEEEGVTECYYDLIQYVKGEERTTRSKDSTVKYFCDQLAHFHRWASQYGIEDPEWNELDMDCSYRSVRPGIVSEKDYLNAISQLYGRSGWRSKDTLFLGFVLFLTFRFGLRSKEARYLRRKDWQQLGGLTWVVVENNRKRRLKTFLSRRAVPLLFELDRIEHELIEMMLSHYDSTSGALENGYLLCELQEGKPQLSPHHENIPRSLIRLLRDVTGNKQLVLHDCRHGFYNVCFAAIYDINSPLCQSLTVNLDPQKIRQIALGPQNALSRRSGMAVTRLMGHADPSCGLRSYNHLITDLCDVLTPLESEKCHAIEGIVDTEEFQQVEIKPAVKLETLTYYPPPSLERVYKTLRLVSQKRSYQKAGQLVGLSPTFCQRLEKLLADMTHHMRFRRRSYDWELDCFDREWVFGHEVPGSLLHFISESAWNRIISSAKNAPADLNMRCPVLEYGELREMFGERRQILARTRSQCEFARCILSMLNVPKVLYYAAARRNSPNIIQHFHAMDFPVVRIRYGGEDGKVIKFDPYHDAQNENETINIYGGIIFKKNEDGVLRNSHEFALAFLAATALVYFK